MLVVLWLSFALTTRGRWGGFSDYQEQSDLGGGFTVEYDEPWAPEH
jgi:hypothetical protein